MVWLIIGIFIVMLIALAALVRSLRLEGAQKVVLTICSFVTMALDVVALVCVINSDISKTIVRIFFYTSLGVGILTLAIAVHLLRKMHNKVFTDKTKEHHESVARILAKEQEENNK